VRDVRLNLGARPSLEGSLQAAPGLSPVCALCEIAFRVGDEYQVIWPAKPPGERVLLLLTVHRGCARQLGAGDLGRIFAALERGLRVPLRILRGG